MGKIDILDRRFFAGPDRFAELINMEIYHGEKVLVPEKLELLKRSYPSLSSASGEKERDILMYDSGQDICYGLEIELESDYSMPEHIMVLYMGEGRWRGREKLEELIRLERFQKLSHETEVVISAHLNNKVLLRKVEEEGEPMCKPLDEWLKEEKQNGRKEGRKVGRKEGKQEERIRILRSLLREGLDEQIIMRVTGCSREEYAAAGGMINI